MEAKINSVIQLENLISKGAKIIKKIDYPKGTSLQVSYGSNLLYLGKKHNEHYWTLYDVQKQETLIKKFYRGSGYAYYSLKKRLQTMDISGKDIINWILRIIGL